MNVADSKTKSAYCSSVVELDDFGNKVPHRKSDVAAAKPTTDRLGTDCRARRVQPFWASALPHILAIARAREPAEESFHTSPGFVRIAASDSKERNASHATSAFPGETFRTNC